MNKGYFRNTSFQMREDDHMHSVYEITTTFSKKSLYQIIYKNISTKSFVRYFLSFYTEPGITDKAILFMYHDTEDVYKKLSEKDD